MHRKTLLPILFLLASLAGSSQAIAQDNLLQNPSFEQPFYEDFRSDGGGFVAHGWTAWWYNDPGNEFDAPEFKQANIEVDPYRVRSGLDAQQYFRPWARHLAGLYQRVQVTANSRVRFTIYGHAWSTFCKDKGEEGLVCDPRNSSYGQANPIAMKVGIDPTGGSDPFSAAIVWSPEQTVYDNYQLFSVEATAQGDHVTVYVYSQPVYPSPVINVYWDDASLVVIGAGGGSQPASPPPSGQGGAPAGGVGTIPTQPPRPDGSQWHVVRPGETLGGIAFAYGVLTQSLRELNNLTTDVVFVGQELLIKPAPTSEPTPTPAPTTVAEAPSSEPPAEQPAEEEAQGEICMLLFEDGNQNGLRDPGEPLLAGGQLNIVGPVNDSALTDGVNEPHCFRRLGPGDYVASVFLPEGYRATGLTELPVTLSGAASVPLSFGAVLDEDEQAPAEEAMQAGEQAPKQPSGFPTRTILTVAGVVVVLGLAVGGGLIAYFTIYKRQAKI